MNQNRIRIKLNQELVNQHEHYEWITKLIIIETHSLIKNVWIKTKLKYTEMNQNWIRIDLNQELANQDEHYKWNTVYPN